MNAKSIPGRSAFSLVELLVALSITSLLLTMLCHFLLTAMQGWSQAEKTTGIFREIRPALTLIQRDLNNLAPTGNLPALALVPPREQPEAANAMLYVLSIQAGSAQRAGRGDVMLIGYWCEWQPEERSFALMRGFQNGDQLFGDLKSGGVALPPSGYAAVPPDGWHGEKSHAAVLIPGSWDFQVRLASDAGTGVEPCPASPTTYTPARCPAWLEIAFKTLDQDSRKRLHTKINVAADWLRADTSLYRWQILPQARQFQARYPVGTGCR